MRNSVRKRSSVSPTLYLPYLCSWYAVLWFIFHRSQKKLENFSVQKLLTNCNQSHVSITTTFHEQLLCQLIYTNLSGTLRGAFSIKVGHNFLLCVLVKLETVLLVKLWNFIASFPPNAVHRHICALCQKVGKIYPGQIKLLFSFCWKGQNVIASNTPEREFEIYVKEWFGLF